MRIPNQSIYTLALSNSKNILFRYVVSLNNHLLFFKTFCCFIGVIISLTYLLCILSMILLAVALTDNFMYGEKQTIRKNRTQSVESNKYRSNILY